MTLPPILPPSTRRMALCLFGLLVTLSPFYTRADVIAVHNVMSTAGTTLGYTFNGSLANSLMVVAVGVENSAANVSGITFGTQDLSLIDEVHLTNGYAGLWYLLDPTPDLAQTLTVTETTGANQDRVAFTVLSLDNVLQSSPLGDVSTVGYSTSPPTTITDDLTLQASGSLVVSTMMNGNIDGHYSIANDLTTLEASVFSGVGGLGLDTATGPGGSLGDTFTAGWTAAGSPPRAGVITAEFQAVVPEISSGLLVLVGGLVLLLLRGRQ